MLGFGLLVVHLDVVHGGKKNSLPSSPPTGYIVAPLAYLTVSQNAIAAEDFNARAYDGDPTDRKQYIKLENMFFFELDLGHFSIIRQFSDVSLSLSLRLASSCHPDVLGSDFLLH